MEAVAGRAVEVAAFFFLLRKKVVYLVRNDLSRA